VVTGKLKTNASGKVLVF